MYIYVLFYIAASPPVDIDLRVLNSTAVSVSWEAPPTIPGTLVGYVLRYRTESGDHIEVNTSRWVYSGDPIGVNTSSSVCNALIDVCAGLSLSLLAYSPSLNIGSVWPHRPMALQETSAPKPM